MKTITAIIFCSCLSIAQSAKILNISPFPTASMFTCNNAVMRALANAGHEIVIITKFAKESAEQNFTSIIDISKGDLIKSKAIVEQASARTLYNWLRIMYNMESSYCQPILKLKEIQDFMKSEEKVFDAMILTVWYHHTCYYEIAQKLRIPVIGIVPQRSWFTSDLKTSNPRHPLFVPFEFGGDINPNNLLNKISNIFQYLEALYSQNKFIENDPHYRKNQQSAEFSPALIFINSHFSYFPRPMNPNMIEIGGIQMTENQPLPDDIQNFLDEAEHNAILFTFGSMIKFSKIPKHKIQSFKEAFAEIPQRVIWKYEEDMEDVPENVMLLKWVPQKEILAHKNVKAFISHCGQGAIHESLYNAVPLISCPLFTDQPINAKIFENLKVAVHLDYATLTKQSILEAINEVINNTKYREKMQKLSQEFRDRSMSPQQTVVYWTEYVIRHKGAAHLKSPAVELNWFQYLLLDVIGFIALMVVTISYAIYSIGKMIYFFIVSYCKQNVKYKCK